MKGIKNKIFKVEKRMEDLTQHSLTMLTCSYKENINNNDVFNTATSSIDILNDDCLINIFQYLSIIDRVRIEGVCKRWQTVVQKSWHCQKALDLYRDSWGFTKSQEKVIRNAHAIHAVLKRCGFFLKSLEFFAYIVDLLTFGEKIGSLCPNLQKVDLAGVSSQIIKNLAENCTDIRHLCLRDTINSSDTELSLLFSRNKKLKSLELVCEIFPNDGKFLLDLPTESIEQLFILHCEFSIRYLNEAIRNLKNLSKFSFDLCGNWNDDTIEAISSNTSLQEIQTGHWLGNITSLKPIINLVNLKVVELSLSDYVNDEFLITLSKHCREISDVNLSGCTVTDVGIASITSLPKLEYLNVDHNEEITDNAFCPMPNLKVLDCFGCKKVTNKGFCSIIETSKKLEILNGCYCKIANSTIRTAIKTTKTRKNKITLRIYLRGTRVKLMKIKERSPLLKCSFSRRQYYAKDYV